MPITNHSEFGDTLDLIAQPIPQSDYAHFAHIVAVEKDPGIKHDLLYRGFGNESTLVEIEYGQGTEHKTLCNKAGLIAELDMYVTDNHNKMTDRQYAIMADTLAAAAQQAIVARYQPEGGADFHDPRCATTMAALVGLTRLALNPSVPASARHRAIEAIINIGDCADHTAARPAGEDEGYSRDNLLLTEVAALSCLDHLVAANREAAVVLLERLGTRASADYRGVAALHLETSQMSMHRLNAAGFSYDPQLGEAMARVKDGAVLDREKLMRLKLYGLVWPQNPENFANTAYGMGALILDARGGTAAQRLQRMPALMKICNDVLGSKAESIFGGLENVMPYLKSTIDRAAMMLQEEMDPPLRPDVLLQVGGGRIFGQ